MNVKVYKVNNWVIHLAVKEKKKKETKKPLHVVDIAKCAKIDGKYILFFCYRKVSTAAVLKAAGGRAGLTTMNSFISEIKLAFCCFPYSASFY